MFPNDGKLSLLAVGLFTWSFFCSFESLRKGQNTFYEDRTVNTCLWKTAKIEGDAADNAWASSLVILPDGVENSPDYCKLGVQVLLSISAGVQVKRGLCGNHARRILHQSRPTSRQLRPDSRQWRTVVARSL